MRPKGKARKNPMKQSRFDFTKVDAVLLPTTILVGRPNIGKSGAGGGGGDELFFKWVPFVGN